MGKKNKEISPSVNGRASICTWELEFHFLEKKQVKRFIKMLMNDAIDFDFEVYKDTNSEDRMAHFVVVRCSWANNLKRVAKYLQKVDYEAF